MTRLNKAKMRKLEKAIAERVDAEAVRVASIIAYDALRGIREKCDGDFVTVVDAALKSISAVTAQAVRPYLPRRPRAIELVAALRS